MHNGSLGLRHGAGLKEVLGKTQAEDCVLEIPCAVASAACQASCLSLVCRILSILPGLWCMIPICQLALGPGVDLSVADREALLVGSLPGLNSVLQQRRVQVNSRWVWLWFGPGNYCSRQRLCSAGRHSLQEAGPGASEKCAMSRLLPVESSGVSWSGFGVSF